MPPLDVLVRFFFLKRSGGWCPYVEFAVMGDSHIRPLEPIEILLCNRGCAHPPPPLPIPALQMELYVYAARRLAAPSRRYLPQTGLAETVRLFASRPMT